MDKVKNYLANLKRWDHALGRLSFDSQGDRELAYVVYQAKNGKLEEIKKYKP